tara:strand:- start:799 stop:2298 length:1500 start_codon:yes stop_codon:yes gene_type:complete
MQTKNFTTQHTVRYLSNKTNFSKQPLYVLTNNMGLTGDDFIAIYRITRGHALESTFKESAGIYSVTANNPISGDGVIGITIGSSDGITSVTGSSRITANSITSAPGQTDVGWSAGVAATSSLLSTTSQGTEYIITMTMKNTDSIDVIINDGKTNTTDISITGLPALANMNVIGNGIRPKGKQNSTYVVNATTDMNGAAGSADITTYLYNQQDAQQNWASSGLTGVFDLSYNGLSAAVVGKAAGHGAMQTAGLQGAGSGTVTGWSGGPIEGAFRLDTNSYLEGVTSSLYNTREDTTTGMTLMTYVRFHATGSNQAFMNICGAEDGFKLAMSGGALSFTNTDASITAGALTTAGGTVGTSTNNMAGQHTVQLNRWYHVAGVVSATGSDSGMKIYIDGNRMQLARTSLIGNVGALTGSIPLSASVSGSQDQAKTTSADVVAMPTLTTPRLLMGSDRTLGGANVPHDLSVTRVFNRALSDSEVFQNFIATIPSNMTLSNFKIG